MDNIIQHFEEKIIRELGEILDNIDEEADISDVISRLEDIFNDFGREIIKYILEESDQLIRESGVKEDNRKQLKNAQYFSGIYSNAEDLWLEVLDYIDDNYEMDEIETIYLAGDGGSWIVKGLRWLPKSKYILDRYHLNQYVLNATAHMPKKRPKIWMALNNSN